MRSTLEFRRTRTAVLSGSFFRVSNGFFVRLLLVIEVLHDFT